MLNCIILSMELVELLSPNKNIEVEPLKFSTKNKKNRVEEPITRKVRIEHSQPLIGLPKGILARLGYIMRADFRDLYVEFCEENPFASEIKIKFKRKRESLDSKES
jgi:hypothetical protein